MQELGTITAPRSQHLSGTNSRSKLAVALELASRGFRIFPLESNSKTPVISSFPTRATTDPEQIRRWWTDPVLGWETDHNIGVACGNGLCALDIDSKEGRPGEASLTGLEAAHGALPATLEATTPSGGRHKLFRVDGPIANSASKLGPGLDVRGDGGLVVGVGSTIDGREYRWANPDVPIAEAPSWLIRLAGEPMPKAANRNEPAVEPDTPYIRERCLHHLAHEAGPAIEGAGGNAHTYGVATRLRDLGASQGLALELMGGAWNETCSPPWPIDELEVVVDNAYMYAKGRQGAASPEADFFGVELPTQPDPFALPARAALRHVWADEIKLDFSPGLVDGVLPMEGLADVIADPGVGKTFWTVDLGCRIAAGMLWCGRPTKQGVVIYLAAEAASSVKRRVWAWKKHHNVSDLPLAVVEQTINLIRGDANAVLSLIKSIQESRGEVVLIVIDTLARAMVGDENSPSDMGAFVDACGRLQKACGGTVLIVHHQGKDRTKGARGHSSLKGAVDTEFEITKADDGKRVVRITKSRDESDCTAFAFRLEPVELGQNSAGRMVSTCVAIECGAAVETRNKPLGPNERIMMTAFEAALAERGDTPPDAPDVPFDAQGVTVARWEQSAMRFLPQADDFRKREAFGRAIRSLIAKQAINQRDGFAWLP